MVQLLADPTAPHHVSSNTTTTSEHGEGSWSSNIAKQEGGLMSREEHAQRMKELAMKRGPIKRAPRRGWSMTDYQGDTSIPILPHTTTTQFDRHASIPENAPWPPANTPSPTPSSSSSNSQQQGQPQQLPHRPKLPPPRRSYSVMDYEPEPPNQPRPSSRLTLLDLPSEIHYLFCDYLDPIDSVCFGLAHSKLYTIHRRKYGTVPLSSRYSGPNDMEWAWRGAGPLVASSSSSSSSSYSSASQNAAAAAATEGDSRAHMRTKGQVYCRKCGISRCELHRHLREWMGPDVEYCEIKEMYGKPAGEDRRPFCYMSSPRNPNRCGRHGGKKIAN